MVVDLNDEFIVNPHPWKAKYGSEIVARGEYFEELSLWTKRIKFCHDFVDERINWQ